MKIIKSVQKVIILILLILCWNNVFANAQDVPRVISYQGVLVDASGKPVNDTKTLTITIVDNVGASHPSGFLHTETFLLSGGLFYARLGQSPQSNMLFPTLDGQWYLKISDGTIIYDSIPLYSTASALNIADNVVTSAKIKDGEVKAIDIGSDEVVKSIKGLKEAIDIVAGNPNIRIRVDGQNILVEGKDTVKAAEQLIGGIPSGVPVGTIVAFYGTAIPSNEWLLCDSSQFDINIYKPLHELLSSQNLPNNVTPDLRGMFLRGSAFSKNGFIKNDPDYITRTRLDTNRVFSAYKIGSVQEDAIIRHQHRTNSPTPANNAVSSTYGSHNSSPLVVQGIGHFNQSHAALTDDASAMTIKVSTETRPKNVYVNYIIKAR